MDNRPSSFWQDHDGPLILPYQETRESKKRDSKLCRNVHKGYTGYMPVLPGFSKLNETVHANNHTLRTKDKPIVIISDASPLIQLAISNHLNMLSKLYTVIIPEQVFEETQHYQDLPDAIEIAKATKSWLAVKPVRNKSEVRRLTRKQKIGKGEAEAIVLCKELDAFAVLTSDRYAAIKANDYGVKTLNIAYVIQQSHDAKILSSKEALKLIDTFINQNILDTQYIRELREKAKSWL
ncbi:MAG: hypothetical protein KGI02_06100 [Thaumarchaeota archaeon]|nr:hypothetical protein [Nitrososphaerota archaeon]MDE1841623.1 hypothetical protein [Nitrososphaerota archaeon]